MISLVTFDLDGTLALSPRRRGGTASKTAAVRLPSSPWARKRRYVHEKQHWDPDFAKRKVIQQDLMQRLPEMSINMGGATSIDITQKGVDKAYGLKRLRDQSGILLEEMMFIGDAIFLGGNDYPAHQLGLKTVKVKDPDGTLARVGSGREDA
ncbi:hypothetical protein K505DRAFT_328453 [Melanomma pulvis-pyrius CBS 109.77]|uniref:HAD-superfamily hydrolase n=1 Tax=Melanomma pulvis-pyrius CBS 109.77 TaxID=1314802 RepID=A0A6A6WYY4_9PLEO|nr:hypothetical protein K505DRAFT_328453 [Melanomma pulvis-pyrius CBS 109.77]